MNLQQRQSSPPTQDDLEITAELPVLDVAAYEASAASTAATGSHPAAAAERDPLNNTDTWHIPAPSLRVSKSPGTAPENDATALNRSRCPSPIRSDCPPPIDSPAIARFCRPGLTR